MRKKKFNMKALVLASVLILSLSLAGCGAQDGGTGDTAAEANGKEPADSGIFKSMEAADLDGSQLSGDIFKENKLTLVNVWNLGCTPCIQEIPHLNEINEAYKDKGVAVYGLYYNFGNPLSDSDKTQIHDLLKSAEATYPHIEPSQRMYESDEMQQLQAFPTTFFVDGEGNIVEAVEGARDFDGWKNLIENILEEVEADA